jgi:hypothetical protein
MTASQDTGQISHDSRDCPVTPSYRPAKSYISGYRLVKSDYRPVAWNRYVEEVWQSEHRCVIICFFPSQVCCQLAEAGSGTNPSRSVLLQVLALSAEHMQWNIRLRFPMPESYPPVTNR